MSYPKKHRGRRKQGSKKRRAKRKNKKKVISPLFFNPTTTKNFMTKLVFAIEIRMPVQEKFHLQD